jgi:hypothetical protein
MQNRQVVVSTSVSPVVARFSSLKQLVVITIISRAALQYRGKLPYWQYVMICTRFQWRQTPHFWIGKCNLWKQIKKKILQNFSKFILFVLLYSDPAYGRGISENLRPELNAIFASTAILRTKLGSRINFCVASSRQVLVT